MQGRPSCRGTWCLSRPGLSPQHPPVTRRGPPARPAFLALSASPARPAEPLPVAGAVLAGAGGGGRAVTPASCGGGGQGAAVPAGRAAGRAAARPGRGCKGGAGAGPGLRHGAGDARSGAAVAAWGGGGRPDPVRGAAGPCRAPRGPASRQPVPPPNPNHIGRRFPFPPREAHAAPCIVFGTAARMRPRAGGESGAGGTHGGGDRGLRTPGEGSSRHGRAGGRQRAGNSGQQLP